jgi:hypothetical protein
LGCIRLPDSLRTPRTRRGPDILAVAGLWALILLAYWLIGPAGRVLAEGDLFTYFYPYWTEATRALRAGRLPLWNAYLFMGVPFLANSQAGVLYPLNWPLWLLLTPQRALHWSILLHLGLAATGTYVLARSSQRLGRLGAWAAAATVALSGYLGAQVEHINQLQTLAWFPWMLALYDRAVRPAPPGNRRGAQPLGLPTPAMASLVGLAGVAGVMLLAGHTQSAFIALVGLGAYGLGPAAWDALRGRGWRPMLRRGAAWLGAAALGALLAAGQLLPTLELARLSPRAGGLLFTERLSFSLSPLYLARALLPGYVNPVEPENIESIATIGVAGLCLLWCSLVGARRRDSSRRRGPLLLAALGLFLALGLYNPVYWLLARFVPGFAHFRAPARWLALWAFGAAALVGAGVEQVARGTVQPTRRAWAVAGAAVAGLALWGALGGQVAWPTLVGWLAAAALAAGLVWLAQERRVRWLASLGLLTLVLAELALSARTLPRARATAPQAYTSVRPAAAHLLAAGEGRQPADRFLSLSALVFDPGDLPELRTIYGPQLSPEALYSLTVAAKHREVLSPNLPLAFGVPAVDGFDGGVLPLARYLTLQGVLLPEGGSPDGRLRENLTTIPDGRWLNLFNVRYVITDKVFDAWVDGVFYDLQVPTALSAPQSAEVAHVPSFEATALGLVSYLEGAAALPDGTPVAEVTVGFADGVTRTFTLRAGLETAEGLYEPGVAHDQATLGGHFWPGRPEGNDYVARLRWDEPAAPLSVAVRATLPHGRLVVRGMSLIDERTGSFQSLILSSPGRLRLVHSGDVKVYENLDVLPRAFVVHRAWTTAGQEEALSRMQAPEFDPRSEIVVEGNDALTHPVPSETDGDGVQITSYTPERVDIRARLDAPGYLILTDAAYPGWRAWVDGEEVEILTADLLFRAVRLDAGSHTVTFAFRPRSVSVGGAVSLASAAAVAGLLIVCVYNQRKERQGD